MMPVSRKQLLDALIGFLILLSILVGSLWMAGVLSPIFGPEKSGLFGKR